MNALQIDLEPSRVALFLDVDGTLVEIRDRPDQVTSTAALRDLLTGLATRLDGALAVVSGRTIADIDRIFEPLRLPAAGAHGVEFRPNHGSLSRQSRQTLGEDVLRRLQQFVAEHTGLLLELKPSGAALHYRARPELGPAVLRELEREEAALSREFSIIAGKMVFELAPRGYDKGGAIRAFMKADPFSNRIPIFVGDDVTDEAGFAAVNVLGGHSIRVGDNGSSEARFSLGDVPSVHRWLAETFCQEQRCE